MGIVQLVIKPLFHLGLDILVFVHLKDTKTTKFTNYVLSMIDLNLPNGSIYFNYFPNFSMNLNEPIILSSQTLNIKTKNMNFIEEAQTIVIIYMIYYKIITIQLNLIVVNNEILLLQYNPRNTQSFCS